MNRALLVNCALIAVAAVESGLNEPRDVVNLLRASGSAGTELTPQPILSDVDGLVAGTASRPR